MTHWQVTVNPGFQVQESDFSNNVVRCDIRHMGSYVQANNCRITGWVLRMRWIRSFFITANTLMMFIYFPDTDPVYFIQTSSGAELKSSKHVIQKTHIVMDRLGITWLIFYLIYVLSSHSFSKVTVTYSVKLNI